MNRALNQENQNFLFNPRKNQNFLDAAALLALLMGMHWPKANMKHTNA